MMTQDQSNHPETAPLPHKSWGYFAFKRLVDIALSAAGLVVTAPLMLAAAIAIKLDSPGPVFFRHVRIGLDRRRGRGAAPPADRRREDRFGKPFVLYKFRTMFRDARERFPEMYRYEYDQAEFEKLIVGRPYPGGDPGKPDPRVTRVGNWLRGTSLDELPNLWNVLKGDMSLVGPRPDVWEHIRYYPPEHLLKFRAKPGLTCLAQILGRGKLTFLQTNEHDLYYVRHRSTFNDLHIIAKTIKVVLTREGAL